MLAYKSLALPSGSGLGVYNLKKIYKNNYNQSETENIQFLQVEHVLSFFFVLLTTLYLIYYCVVKLNKPISAYMFYFIKWCFTSWASLGSSESFNYHYCKMQRLLSAEFACKCYESHKAFCSDTWKRQRDWKRERNNTGNTVEATC